jgi:hypothetical protein
MYVYIPWIYVYIPWVYVYIPWNYVYIPWNYVHVPWIYVYFAWCTCMFLGCTCISLGFTSVGFTWGPIASHRFGLNHPGAFKRVALISAAAVEVVLVALCQVASPLWTKPVIHLLTTLLQTMNLQKEITMAWWVVNGERRHAGQQGELVPRGHNLWTLTIRTIRTMRTMNLNNTLGKTLTREGFYTWTVQLEADSIIASIVPTRSRLEKIPTSFDLWLMITNFITDFRLSGC